MSNFMFEACSGHVRAMFVNRCWRCSGFALVCKMHAFLDFPGFPGISLISIDFLDFSGDFNENQRALCGGGQALCGGGTDYYAPTIVGHHEEIEDADQQNKSAEKVLKTE